MGHRYLLYPYRTRCPVPVHDPDLYDNSIVAYKTAAQQTVNLVLDTIRLAMKKEKVAGELHLHSDQGFQYTSHGYFKLTQSYGITPFHVKTRKLL